MRAADDQSQERRLEVRAREHGGVDVAPEMVDAGDRARPRRAQTFCHAHPDQQTAGEARTARDGYQADVIGARARAVERQVEQPRQTLQMVPRRELGDDSAEVLVQLHLRVDHVGQDAPAVFNQSDRGFVAAGFDSEDEPSFYCWSPFVSRSRRRPRTSASIRSRLASYARRNRGEWMESDHITIASSPLSVY